MNHAIKAPAFSTPSSSLPWRAAALFHATPVSERRRRTQWNYKFNNQAKRFGRMEAKRTLLRNVSMYAEYLFESWQTNDRSGSSSNSTSWFKKQCWPREKKNNFGSQESDWGNSRNKRKGTFEFIRSDDEDVETIFRTTFGGERIFYWSYNSDQNFQWRNSTTDANQRGSCNRRYGKDYESDTSTEPESDLISERQALGLRASGPLKIDEVKNAYRARALQWHPDRHQGSSKVVAEEKFKYCSAAYKSICDRLSMD